MKSEAWMESAKGIGGEELGAVHLYYAKRTQFPLFLGWKRGFGRETKPNEANSWPEAGGRGPEGIAADGIRSSRHEPRGTNDGLYQTKPISGRRGLAARESQRQRGGGTLQWPLIVNRSN